MSALTATPGSRPPSVLHSAVRWATAGAASFGIDLALLVLLHGQLRIALLPATAIAYGASVMVNFNLNRTWSFRAKGLLGRRMLRYAQMMVVNYAATILIVWMLTQLGLYYVLAKCIAVACIAGLNFVAFKLWVFR